MKGSQLVTNCNQQKIKRSDLSRTLEFIFYI